MNELYKQVFRAMEQFHKLRIGDMIEDISKGECVTLMVLAKSDRKEEGKLNVSELADLTKSEPSAISRILKGLEEKGYIARMINAKDRRNTYVALTEQGKEKTREIEDTFHSFGEAVVSRLKAEDVQRMIEVLDETYQIAVEEIKLRKVEKEAGGKKNEQNI